MKILKNCKFSLIFLQIFWKLLRRPAGAPPPGTPHAATPLTGPPLVDLTPPPPKKIPAGANARVLQKIRNLSCSNVRLGWCSDYCLCRMSLKHLALSEHTKMLHERKFRQSRGLRTSQTSQGANINRSGGNLFNIFSWMTAKIWRSVLKRKKA